ncbi:MAG: hypothetical protein ACE5LA_00410 [Dehalococcoidales bacterium]
MFPSEMVILMAIAVAGDSSKKLLTRPMDITGEYVGYLYDSLVRRGYLRGNRSRGYALTTMGRETLFEFLRENKNRARETIKALQQLSIEFGQEIDKLEEAAIRVK